MNYFKKYDPKQKVMFSDGSWFQFQSEIPGREWGVLKTDNERLVSELRKCIRREVGGIFEIDEYEYEDLKKKVNDLPLQRHLNESISLGQIQNAQRSAAAQGQAAAVVDTNGNPFRSKIKDSALPLQGPNEAFKPKGVQR